MLPQIEILLEEFELLTFDEKAFFVLTSAEELQVCISFDASLKNNPPPKKQAKPWRVWFKLSEAASKQECSRDFLPSVLDGFKVSQLQFRQELAGKLLLEAAYADEMIRNVKNLLGEEALRESIMSTQRFMDGLKNMVGQIMAEKNTNAQPFSPNQSDQSNKGTAKEANKDATRRGHLRIISSGK